MAVMIGVDPHKGSHTAVALDEHEQLLGELKVRSSSVQAARLIEWAATWPERTRAVEGAGGLGYLLAQQLLAAGEEVVDVPPKLAARVRILSSGKVNKNDPNDARAVAVAALRSPGVKPVAAEDHAGVLRVWAKRNNDLGRLRNKAACRLHSVLCHLVAGGIATEISADAAERLLETLSPTTVLEAAKVELAAELIADVRHLDEQMAASKRRLAAAKASGTTLTRLYGVGPVGNRQLNHALHIAAISQIRHPGTEGRTYYERKLAEGKTPNDAFRALERRISDAVYRQLRADAERRQASEGAREGKRGATQQPARPALTPNTGSSAKPLPDPTPRNDTPTSPRRARRARRSRPAALASRTT